MYNIKEYQAICGKTGNKIIFGIQEIKNSLGDVAQEFTCSHSDNCTKCDCFYRGGTVKYNIIKL